VTAWVSAPPALHACASWTEPPMRLDLDSGVVVFPDTFRGGIGVIYELASGFKGCCTGESGDVLSSPSQDGNRKLKAFLAATYEVRPSAWKDGWSAQGSVAFSHIYDPLAKKDGSDQPWYQGTIPPRGSSCFIARSRRRRNRKGAYGWPCRGCSLARRLAPERTRPPKEMAAREALPFSNSPASEDGGRYDGETRGSKPRSPGAARRSSGAHRLGASPQAAPGTIQEWGPADVCL